MISVFLDEVRQRRLEQSRRVMFNIRTYGAGILALSVVLAFNANVPLLAMLLGLSILQTLVITFARVSARLYADIFKEYPTIQPPYAGLHAELSFWFWLYALVCVVLTVLIVVY